MIKAAIVGATGYTGAELIRILTQHTNVELVCITSRAEAGVNVADLYPNLRGHCDLSFVAPDVRVLSSCDIVFFATPHGVAQSMMQEILAAGVKAIDLSADFRLKDIDVWEKWYNTEHQSPELVKQAVYGLPEVYRDDLANANLVACPGCYPTAVQLGFLPLLEQGVIKASSLIANAASGVTGAGRQAKIGSLYTEVSDSFKAYGATGHRHLPEIKQGLQNASSEPVDLVFVPHLVPMLRGIHATLYAELTADVDVQQLFEERYVNEPFVDVLPAGSHPETRSVKASNMCRIAVHKAPESNKLVILSVIDNICKGASGQAVQNMNIMFGFAENEGLQAPALIP